MDSGAQSRKNSNHPYDDVFLELEKWEAILSELRDFAVDEVDPTLEPLSMPAHFAFFWY